MYSIFNLLRASLFSACPSAHMCKSCVCSSIFLCRAVVVAAWSLIVLGIALHFQTSFVSSNARAYSYYTSHPTCLAPPNRKRQVGKRHISSLASRPHPRRTRLSRLPFTPGTSPTPLQNKQKLNMCSSDVCTTCRVRRDRHTPHVPYFVRGFL